MQFPEYDMSIKITGLIGLFFCVCLICSPGNLIAREQDRVIEESGKIDLVVGIMVDQMRPDYIDRYRDMLSPDGFKRLEKEGFLFSHAQFDYMPTATGAGHAGVYTGSTPSVHGAIGNSWYVRESGREVNVIEVQGYKGTGTTTENEGSKGPGNLLTTTFGDELRLHTNFRSKVVSMSRKDRGAILPVDISVMHTGMNRIPEGL
jgi:hypothetical protein